MKKKNIIYIITFGGCGRGRCKILVCHDFIEKKKIITKVCEEMGWEFILKVKRIMEAIFHLSLFLVKEKEAFNCLKMKRGFTVSKNSSHYSKKKVCVICNCYRNEKGLVCEVIYIFSIKDIQRASFDKINGNAGRAIMTGLPIDGWGKPRK